MNNSDLGLENLVVMTWRLADLGSDLFENKSKILKHHGLIKDKFFKLETCERILIAFMCSKVSKKSCDICLTPSLNKYCNLLKLNNNSSKLSDSMLKVFSGVDAFRHLCIVAGSLDSSTLGEPEILGQFKKAIKENKKLKNLYGTLEEILILSFKAGKKVHTSSDIPKGRISILSNVEGIFNEWIINQNIGLSIKTPIKLAIIGTGKMGLDANKYFSNKNVEISMISRNRIRQDNELSKLAYQSFEDFSVTGSNIDVLVLCSSTVEPFITKSNIKAFLKPNKSILIFDLGVPRNSDPEINSLSNVSLYQMEQLIAISTENKNQRKSDLPIAYSIIEQHVKYVQNIFEKRKISPLIKDLRLDLQRVAEKRLINLKGTKENFPPDFYRWYNNTVKELMHISQQHLERSVRDNKVSFTETED